MKFRTALGLSIVAAMSALAVPALGTNRLLSSL